MRAQNSVAVSDDGTPIHFDVRGDGANAIVFVHGWCCDRSFWNEQVDHFASRFTVVRIDLAGHGASGRTREEWTMPAFGADVVAVVEQLGLDRVVLVAHSMGGAVIVEASRRLPGSVAGLVGVDTFRDVEFESSPAQIAEIMAPFRTDFVTATRAYVRSMFVPTSDPALVERVATAMSAAPPHIGIEALEAVWAHDRQLSAGLREIRVPKVAINARRTNLEAAKRHGIEVVPMPGVGHFCMLEDPATFNRLLEEAVLACI